MIQLRRQRPAVEVQQLVRQQQALRSQPEELPMEALPPERQLVRVLLLALARPQHAAQEPEAHYRQDPLPYALADALQWRSRDHYRLGRPSTTPLTLNLK